MSWCFEKRRVGLGAAQGSLGDNALVWSFRIVLARVDRDLFERRGRAGFLGERMGARDGKAECYRRGQQNVLPVEPDGSIEPPHLVFHGKFRFLAAAHVFVPTHSHLW
ncbi:hypothetical protein ASC96_02950 [Rhizobium sp. Root1204]|nr:hypothetical protein ASC96_02950 [Rhizobium sp. Root1204]